jgi:two-component system, NarL family, nitrate/nitrite response regulator NarL
MDEGRRILLLKSLPGPWFALVAAAFLFAALEVEAAPRDSWSSDWDPESSPRHASATAYSSRLISVFVVADVWLHREGLEQALQRTGDVEVIGSESRIADAIPKISAMLPDVVVVDFRQPEGLQVVKVIGDLVPAAKVVALAVEEIDEEIIAWAEAGIAGLVGPDGSLDDLLTAIRSARRGEMRCSPRIAAILMARVARLSSRGGTRTQTHLTPREIEIVHLIDQGYSNIQIAKELCIALSTVKNHVHNVLEKLHVHHRTQVSSRMGEEQML